MLVVSLDQFADLLRAYPAKVEAAAIAGCRSAAALGVGYVVEEIQKAKPHPAVNTGQLVGSVRFRNIARGANISVDAPQAVFMENGIRPFAGGPPIAALTEWAKRKFGLDDKAAEGVAWSIRKKISERGIEPRHFFVKAIKRVEEVVAHEIETEIRAIIP